MHFLSVLQHSIYTASKFRIWTLNGRQRLSEFLAELGLPLVQCQQRFSSMDLQLRTGIADIFSRKTDKYGLDRLLEGAFQASFGYRNRFCASDAAYAAFAILEQRKGGAEGEEESFLRALDSLSAKSGHVSLLEEGVKLAKEMLEAVMQQVQTFFDLHSIVSAGPFLYAIIQVCSLSWFHIWHASKFHSCEFFHRTGRLMCTTSTAPDLWLY